MARKARNHYDALGVSRNADGEEIRKAYRKKAKEHHPDATGGGDPTAFHEAQAAYEALKDPRSRREYDEELRRRERPGGRPFGESSSRRSGDPSGNRAGRGDPFSTPFGTDTGRTSNRGRPSAGSGGIDDILNEEDELFGRILNELFGGGGAAGYGAGRGGGRGNRGAAPEGRSAFGGFGDLFSEPGEGAFGPSPSGRRAHRHMRDEEPLSVVVHLSPDETYTGGTVSVDLGAGRSILASIPPGVRDGDVIRSEFVDHEGPRELKLRIRVD